MLRGKVKVSRTLLILRKTEGTPLPEGGDGTRSEPPDRVPLFFGAGHAPLTQLQPGAPISAAQTGMTTLPQRLLHPSESGPIIGVAWDQATKG